MSRTIPAALQVHLDQAVTTTCRLLRIALRDGRVFGVTSLDADVTYNDGRGAVTYSANQGVDVSAISASSDMSVANAEAQSLLVTTPTGITEAMIEAGDLRDAEWTLLLVNYRDLAAGHIILGAGDVGEVTKRWGLVWTPELLSYSVRLNQPIGTHWSRTCRAIDGSPADSQTGCGRLITTYPGTVTAVGAESDRQFTGNHAAGAFPFAPGRVQWLTGLNTGRVGFVEVHASGAVTLGNAMPYAVAIGDTYTIADTCPRTWAACVARGNQLNFKGEPLIPTGDAASVSTPGAQAPRSVIQTMVQNSLTGMGPIQPSLPALRDVPLQNPEFQSAGGWVARRMSASPGFSIHTTAPGQRRPGVLRWQSGPLSSSGFDFGDKYENLATAVSPGGRVAAEMWVKCTAVTGATPTEYAFALIGIQTYEDEACTVPIGGLAMGAEAQFREVGDFRLLVVILPDVPAGRYCRLQLLTMNSSTGVTLEADNAAWTLDAAGWATRGQP